MSVEQVIAAMSLLGGLIAVWIQTQTKLKELEIRMSSLEKQDNRIEEKIDRIEKTLNLLAIKLENKQDRP